MTYSSGSIILATDYESFRGVNGPNQAFPNDSSAQTKVAALIGVGYGSRGYGQTSTLLPGVSSGGEITANNWNTLRNVMSTLNTHTGSGLTLQPVVAVDQLITAENGSGTRKNIAALISSLDANRLDAAASEMNLTQVLTSTRTSNWSSTIYHEFYVNFGSEDNARYFFNSGGEVRFIAARTGGTATAVNTAISTMLNDMGTIKFGASSTSYTGGGGTAANIGYYGLTDSYQQCFIHNGPSGSYANISYIVTAKREIYTGVNGGNGTQVRFRATFGLGGYAVTATGTLTSSISSYRSVGIVSVAAPSYATTVNIGP